MASLGHGEEALAVFREVHGSAKGAITFDEFCNFRLSGKMSKWQDQEFLALIEWLDECQRKVRPLNRNWAYQASCVVL